jgi:RNA polymerase sigma-70 factor (ECF subfamily)
MGRNPPPAASNLFAMVLDDREVLEACQRGERDAFRAFFEANRDRVYSIALRYSGGDEAAAMDIAQDTFLKLLSRIQDFRGDSSFDSWLYRIVANSCLDHRRRARRLLPLLEDWVNLFACRRETALQDLLQAEMRDSVQRTVATLKPEQRIVVVLRYTENLSYEEIAEILGCSSGTVASRLNRAHKVLERRLAYLRGGRVE